MSAQSISNPPPAHEDSTIKISKKKKRKADEVVNGDVGKAAKVKKRKKSQDEDVPPPADENASLVNQGSKLDMDAQVDKAAEKAARKEKKRKRQLLEAQPTDNQRELPTPDETPAPSGESNLDGSAEVPVSGDAAPEKESKEARKARKRREKAEKAALAASENTSPENNASTSTANQPSSLEPSSDAIDAFLAANSIVIHTSPTSGEITPILSFDQLDIAPSLRPLLSEFKNPTPIQACAWPGLLAGKDVIGIAETGSGKTLAFALPIISKLIKESPLTQKSKKRKRGEASGISVLVVAPTRELALQTHETFLKFGGPFNLKSVCVFGGVSKDAQINDLASNCQIVTGTPGRILDLMNQGDCDLSAVTYLVLDEADRMLDRGFENDIRQIIERTSDSSHRQTLMFSATWPDSIRKLASTFLKDPIRITVGKDELTANSRVEQIVEVFDDARSKDRRLLPLLRQLQADSKGRGDDSLILVFALYKKEAARVEENLRRQGFKVGGLHGDLSQNQRMEALENFKTGKTRVMVATDVAARGLDIPNVAAVINYTFPLTIEDYIHRIGRTGRAGKSGKAITYFTGDLHERALAGELARVMRESGFEAEGLKKFPMTIKKKEHGAYGAFFRNDIPASAAPTKIKF
ncbi:DEAD-domain-containing protein [Sistotremastrum niveocremeum HHB9708]|uniref:RNA helicase n=1 Tax=Sistotremastrum niveocremeum HHB9708 TaxID=1314777 RepID=A0A164R551_9AGAM|nr:DEAD-domain-containing protein [Sistotremastrum niveocremeum HHB9708]